VPENTAIIKFLH